MIDSLPPLKVVLVEPAGERNVGAIARVMKNFGYRQLVLVNPQCSWQSKSAVDMAVHAKDILTAAQVVSSVPEALTGCSRAIATTARARREIMLERPQPAFEWLLKEPAALIFGPEERGLSNEELQHAQRYVCLPTSAEYPSLNLAQSVGICLYELVRLGQEQKFQTSAPSSEPLQGQETSLPIGQHPSRLEKSAPIEQLEGYYQQLEALLLKVGFLYPHTAASRMQKLRQLFNRAQPADTEVAMLRGIISQIEWALSVSGYSPDSSEEGSQQS
jgi:tRNA/rRNA methyltransferase